MGIAEINCIVYLHIVMSVKYCGSASSKTVSDTKFSPTVIVLVE